LAKWPPDFAFGREARTSLGLTYGHLAAELSRQGMDVVCATISMFHEVFQWNRKNIQNYREIYLRVPLDVLTARDSKGLYARNRQKNYNRVAGFGLATEEPSRADLVIENHGRMDPNEAVACIWNTLVSRPGADTIDLDRRQ
jgi:adenylylsulfate kinase-like enzyme